MSISGLRRRSVIFIGATGMASSGMAVAQTKGALNRVGVVNFVTGDATLWDAGSQLFLTNGSEIKQGSAVETGPNSEVHIVLDDGGLLALRPSSRMQIEQVRITGAFNDSMTLTLLRGAMRSITGWVGKFDKASYQLRAGTATVGIRGTDHEVAIIPLGEERHGEIPGIHNWVAQGGTTLTNAGGHIDIEPGHAAWVAHSNHAPQAHEGIPGFLKRRQTKNENRIDRHFQHITEHIEKRMLKRGMIKPGEKIEDAQLRHRKSQSNPSSQNRDATSDADNSNHAHEDSSKRKHHKHK